MIHSHLSIFWLTGLPVGLLLGVIWAKREDLSADGRALHLSGSPATLIVLLSIFTVKFLFGSLHALRPDLEFVAIEVLFGGGVAGLFLGRALGLSIRWAKLASAVLKKTILMASQLIC